MNRPRHWAIVLPAAVALLAGCDQVKGSLARLGGADNSPPESLPVLLNDSLPFKYPVALYIQLVDDSVTLRLHIDEYGRPVPESTRVEVPATHAAFDTAALVGARELYFQPAKRKGKAIAYTVLFPIQFKVPLQPATPNDSSKS